MLKLEVSASTLQIFPSTSTWEIFPGTSTLEIFECTIEIQKSFKYATLDFYTGIIKNSWTWKYR